MALFTDIRRQALDNSSQAISSGYSGLIRRLRGHTAARMLRLFAVASLDAFAVLVAFWIVGLQVGSAIGDIVVSSGSITLIFASLPVTLFILAGLYRRSWRFLTFGDCAYLGSVIVGALLLAWALCVAIHPGLLRHSLTLAAFSITHGALVLVFMASMRIMRRSLRDQWRRRRAQAGRQGRAVRRILLLGSHDWARGMIELIRADAEASIEIVGILSKDVRDHSLRMGGIQIVGAPKDLPAIVERLDRSGRRPNCVVLQEDDESLAGEEYVRLFADANRLDMVLARARDPWRQAGGAPKLNLEYLPLGDLLGRREIRLDDPAVKRIVAGRRILVTGAGGTIGGELVRQLANFGPAEIVLLDHAEYGLYSIDMEIGEKFPEIVRHRALCSVRQREALFRIFDEHRPEIVYHAAALKHVPLVEENPGAGVQTNVFGTCNVADAVCEFGARAMVQVSTDKAVNPVGTMGATKRVGELYCQALDLVGAADPGSPRFMTVRFGNVLGSSGSLIPLFQRQLANGQPLTVTHPDIERFFMTVEEAVQLILTSSARALEKETERGTIFVLDMGEPVKIVDIARRLIRLAGMEPEVDVPIRFVGLRPGEKLYEELFDSSEERFESAITGIFEARPCPIPLPTLIRKINELRALVLADDEAKLTEKVHELLKLSSRSTWRDFVDGRSSAVVDRSLLDRIKRLPTNDSGPGDLPPSIDRIGV